MTIHHHFKNQKVTHNARFVYKIDIFIINLTFQVAHNVTILQFS